LKNARHEARNSHTSGERRIDLSGGIPQGHIIAERYRVQRRIGEGGMSQVFSARDLLSGRDVALKIITFDGKDQDRLEGRFRREIDIARQLRSPAFVPMYDHGFCVDSAFIAMELLTGENLEERLLREGRLSPAATLVVFRALSAGLREVHDLCIIHRDLKPSNIFFARSGEEENVRLLDFGIAKDLWSPEKLTRQGYVLGSPRYMSPEQAAGKEVDARSDAWSVAVILYRCLTGKRPFDGAVGRIILQIANEPHRPPTNIASGLPHGIDAFFDRALAKRPENRFPDITSMLRAFELVVPDRLSGKAGEAPQDAPPRKGRSPPTTPSSPTQAGDISYEEYAAMASKDERPSDRPSISPTVEVPASILTGHSTDRPPRLFPPSPWQEKRKTKIHPLTVREFALYVAIGTGLLILIAFGVVAWMTG